MQRSSIEPRPSSVIGATFTDLAARVNPARLADSRRPAREAVGGHAGPHAANALPLIVVVDLDQLGRHERGAVLHDHERNDGTLPFALRGDIQDVLRLQVVERHAIDLNGLPEAAHPLCRTALLLHHLDHIRCDDAHNFALRERHALVRRSRAQAIRREAGDRARCAQHVHGDAVRVLLDLCSRGSPDASTWRLRQQLGEPQDGAPLQPAAEHHRTKRQGVQCSSDDDERCHVSCLRAVSCKANAYAPATG
mmetsp:Transcript_14462/g.48186  ORF Transcript_14462/g.48186 Transcript_14462/m.48186 type:complete len:251 (+) Transcript_14462:113-865(+)